MEEKNSREENGEGERGKKERKGEKGRKWIDMTDKIRNYAHT